MFKKRDPVCGVKVSKKSAYVFIYKGKTYYFDSEACRDTFMSSSQVHIERKKIGGFLAWIARSSQNVPKSCHEKKK